ncbi:MAG: hypothetical protein WA634_01580 [Silvibacterium sp.]
MKSEEQAAWIALLDRTRAIVRAYRHRTIADRPDYLTLAKFA